jgi:hypothetical protein
MSNEFDGTAKQKRSPASLKESADERITQVFATIHHRSYKPGEIEKINKELQQKNLATTSDDLLSDKIFAFLQRYNPERTCERALARSIKAALQHNRLYVQGLDSAKRQLIRNFWGNQLSEISKRYVATHVSSAHHEECIIHLKNKMNEKFGHYFESYKDTYGRDNPGFRISHSQKSLNLFLKYLWCLNYKVSPPQCPVDRRILLCAGEKPSSAGWVHVDDITSYRNHISILQKAAGSSTLAEWEMQNFVLS